MSRTQWPEGVEFGLISLEPDERECAHCGRFTYVCDDQHRYLHSLEGPLHVVTKVACCPDKGCPGHGEKVKSASEMSIAPPYWSVGWDLFAWMGQRRFARHWSVPQIRAELKDRYKIDVSADLIEDYTAKYEVIVAARESDIGQLALAYAGVTDLMLTIDGLQPEKGHETLYVVRELRAKRVWFAQPLMSDKQDAFVHGVENVFPGVPHRYCANHFLRDAAKPVLEADSHAKVQMRRKVRGLREIERRVLTQQGAASAASTPTPGGELATTGAPSAHKADNKATPADTATIPTPHAVCESGQVVLDYCAAVRGILNDDQGGPLYPPGVRMAEALLEVKQSIERALDAEKGDPVIAR
jgi:hypothetical protein